MLMSSGMDKLLDIDAVIASWQQTLTYSDDWSQVAQELVLQQATKKPV